MLKKILRFILYINYESNSVILCVLGIKIKFRNYKAEYKKMKQDIKNLKILSNKYLDIIKTNADMYEKYILIPSKHKLDNERYPIAKQIIKDILDKPEFPLFEMIEIETINRCCGDCDFCPVNRKDDTREFKLMDENLFENIIQQLKDINYDGRVCLFSNNEPLMDKRIFDFAKYAKNALPNNHFSFFTNGILLNKDKFDKLIPYCDTFCIDIYYSERVYIPDNIKPIIDYCLVNQQLQKKVILCFTDKKAIRNNRGGNSKNRNVKTQLKTPCILPFKQVIVRPDGKLSLCCNDALGEYTLGDLTKDSLVKLWNGETYWAIRNKLVQGRTSIKMCEYCDNFGGFGTNASKDYVFTQKQFEKSWREVKKYI